MNFKVHSSKLITENMFLRHWHEKKKFQKVFSSKKNLLKYETPKKVFFPTIKLVLTWDRGVVKFIVNFL